MTTNKPQAITEELASAIIEFYEQIDTASLYSADGDGWMCCVSLKVEDNLTALLVADCVRDREKRRRKDSNSSH